MFVEACLRGHFARSHRTRPDLEVSLVMRREDALNLNDGGFFVASLDDSVGRVIVVVIPHGVGRAIVVVIPHLVAMGFGAADVEAVETILGCGIIRSTDASDRAM